MATPRKHWFRVADALTVAPLSNDELATLIRLMGAMHQRWARDGLTAEEAQTIALRAGDLAEVTGKGTLRSARHTLQRCAEHVSISVEYQGSVTLIKWPKWSEFQGLDAREQGRPGAKSGQKTPPPRSAPAPSPAPSTERETEPPAPRAVAPGSRKPKALDRRAVEAWPAIVAAFAEHGRELGDSIGADRAALIAKRLDEGATLDDLVAAVHGYVRGHGGLDARDGFDPGAHFKPRTVFKAEGFSDRVDDGRRAQTRQPSVLAMFPNVRSGK